MNINYVDRLAICPTFHMDNQEQVNNLSDEMIELYTSFECEESVDDGRNTQCGASGFSQTAYSHDNTFIPSDYGYSADISFNTNDTAGSNLTRHLQGLSLNGSTYLSASKLKDFKAALIEANDAHCKFMISQFIIDCYKASEEHISSQLSHKMRRIMSGCRLDTVSNLLKTRRGKTMNVLGLSYDMTSSATNVRLTSLEAQELKDHVLHILVENLDTLAEQKRSLKGSLRPHCDRVVEADSLLPQENVRLSELRQELGEQLTQGSHLTTSTALMLQQLATLTHMSERELSRATYCALRDKAAYLHTATSILRLKLDQAVNRDTDRVKAINNLGDELRKSAEEMSHQLKRLQKSLTEYEKREETSKQYKDIIVEYAKSKRLLNHKYQTLSLLKESSISFS